MKMTTVTLLKCPCDGFTSYSSRILIEINNHAGGFGCCRVLKTPGWIWTASVKVIWVRPFWDCCLLNSEILLSVRRSHKGCIHTCRQNGKMRETHHRTMQKHDCLGSTLSIGLIENVCFHFSLWYIFLKLFYVSRVIYPSERQERTERGRDCREERERERHSEKERESWGTSDTTLWFPGLNLILFALCKRKKKSGVSLDFCWFPLEGETWLMGASAALTTATGLTELASCIYLKWTCHTNYLSGM